MEYFFIQWVSSQEKRKTTGDQADQYRRDRSGLTAMWRRKQTRSEGTGDITLEDIGCTEDDGFPQSSSTISLGAELGDLANTDKFLEEVAKTSSVLLIGRQEAETEVFTDILIRKHGNVDKAMLHIVTSLKLETKILILINNLIHRGADASAADADGKTPLHFAAHKNWKGVAAKLLDNNASAHKRDKQGVLPLKIALDGRHDEMAALLLAYMPNFFVRGLFTSNGSKAAEMSFHDLVRSDMQKTTLSVLDCLIEMQDSSDHLRVFYNVLECDENGIAPRESGFNAADKSPLQIIAKQGNKNIVYHDAVRLLVRRKWKEYARSRFQVNSFIYLLALFSITYSVIVGVMAADPTQYASPLHVSRAVFEVFSLCMVLMTLTTEINQLRRHRLEYFTDAFNWFDLSASVLLLLVVPLRFTESNAQWHVFAFGYMCWVIRIFKFAAIFRQTGAYAQILGRVLIHDFVQFGIVFLVILLAFSGSFFLSLRGDGDLNTHSDTSSFWGILFVGVRTLSEAQPVVEYTGSDGYGMISAAFMVAFLFACCVILLNILIAQLSDTYQKVQQDAQRGLEVNRAWIVARVELNSFFLNKDFRTLCYVEYEDIPELRAVLTKWDSPPLNEMNKYVRDIWDSLDSHKMNLLTLQHRMARQENALRKMQEQMNFLVSLHTDQQDGADRPKFYRSDTELAQSRGRNHLVGQAQGGAALAEEDGVHTEDVTLEMHPPEQVNGGFTGEIE